MADSKDSLERNVSISNGVLKLGAYIVTVVGFFIYMHMNLNANTEDIALIKSEVKEDRNARIELEKSIIGLNAKMDYMIKKLDGKR